MFSNWFEGFDPFDYNKVKENINKFNTKVLNFWRDFYNDVFKSIKSEEK